MTERLPLFPLHTVLFPGGHLPLRIFEARYVDMVSLCMRDSVPFGVCLIRSGPEVGVGADFASIGTSARIIDWSRGPDGLLGIVARGERRFGVRASAADTRGLYWADVQWRHQEQELQSPHAADSAAAPLLSLFQKLAHAEGWEEQLSPEQLSNGYWITDRIAERLGSPAQRQAVLEMDGIGERVAYLRQVLSCTDVAA